MNTKEHTIAETTPKKVNGLMRLMRPVGLMGLMGLMGLLWPMGAQAQISIGGNVYGGGNLGDVDGNTTVTVYEGDLNNVFGGARMANVGGHAFTHIDGEHASSYVLINNVYGGNDISGNIGTKPVEEQDDLPTELTGVETKTGSGAMTEAKKNDIDKSWDAFVRITSNVTDGTQVGKVYIGQLFGGGNGDYDYTSAKLVDPENPDDPDAPANPYYGLTKPELGKTYLEVVGGSIVYAFGGGNNATVTEKTVIYVDNPSKVVNSIIDATNPHAGDGGELLTTKRIYEMGYNPGFTQPTSDAFQIGCFFGGNNKAPMSIRPTWNLQSGLIRNLYSGGNKGDMISPDGLILDINPDPTKTFKVDKVFGGCRMADVHPAYNGVEGDWIKDAALDNLFIDEPAYSMLPKGMPARVLVWGGEIGNVYGGNDISGRVYGGNCLGIYTNIKGDVFGGGNGAYPYTDNADLKDDPVYGDVYYEVPTGKTSLEALNDFRPNAEQVSLRIHSGDQTKPTIIKGRVFLGGDCATLKTEKTKPTLELRIGSWVYIEDLYLGNNGEGMVNATRSDNIYDEGVLYTMQRRELHDGKKLYDEEDEEENPEGKYNSVDLTNATNFAKYMDGCAMELVPNVIFDDQDENDGDIYDYIPYSAYVGSFYCGGNRGSMKSEGTHTYINLNHKLTLCKKLVGGSRDADIAASAYNAAYEGGVIGAPDENGDKLLIDLAGMVLRPMRWKRKYTAEENNGVAYTPVPDPANNETWAADKINVVKNGDEIDDKGKTYTYDNVPVLEFNTYDARTGQMVNPVTSGTGGTPTDVDLNRRLVGGNVYGGCYTSGHVNGNVVINITAETVQRDEVFDEVELDVEGEPKLYGNDDNKYNITERRTGVILDKQGMDVLGSALNIFGGGYGKDTEIWGSTTINLKKGYSFQIFGGSEEGAIGKGTKDTDGKRTYSYDAKYSTHVNLDGSMPGVQRGSSEDPEDMAECEFMYGGGFMGPIAGDTHINLGNGRIFNSFAGSCYADIYGHTETYVGRNSDDDSDLGFPYVRDHVYGGNDLGGKILGVVDFKDRLTTVSPDLPIARYAEGVTNASAYTEYIQGRVEYIFGGCFGDYNYETGGEFADYHDNQPRMESAFVYYRPNANPLNRTSRLFGAGQGASLVNLYEKDQMQDRSYVLVDITGTVSDNLKNIEVFGGGQNCGVGMGVAKPLTDKNEDRITAAAVIDLARGEIKSAYGGSLSEGITRRTIVNVPEHSTVKVTNLFAGAYGADYGTAQGFMPCDVYDGTLNYSSDLATVTGALYGGNNNNRRTLYGKVNINSPVWSNKESGYLATVYGAGKGGFTWSEYTEVNLNDGAKVYEVYGGGEMGCVVNKGTVDKLKALFPEVNDKLADIPAGQETNYEEYYGNRGLASPLAKYAEDFGENGTAPEFVGKKFNTNVLIHEGATVVNYAYGGGLGDVETHHNTVELNDNSGNVFGTTYVALLGGTVEKDIYGAGTVGSVINSHKVEKDDFNENFIASSNVYIQGGTCRNVYGGGWNGAVGFHKEGISYSMADDDLGETNVIIGKPDGTSFINGIPAIQRNAYGGGEGGPVWGTSHITLHNGYIGYVHLNAGETQNDQGVIVDGATTDEHYEEKIIDETHFVNNVFEPNTRLKDSGNIFGGGYVDNSSVDYTNVFMYGGMVRGSLFGGGEIAAVGRGDVKEEEGSAVRVLNEIYDPGSTYIEMYGGQVLRDVFGGGRGYNNLGMTGSLYTDGYVFGKTEVHIRGGEVGSKAGLAEGYGNVFGGGDIGYVYSGSGKKVGERGGDESLTNGVPSDGGGYYYKDGVISKGMTEDCKVVIEPYCQVTGSSVTINGTTYDQGDYVPQDDLNKLGKTDGRWNNLDERGVTVYNAVFAGGNVSAGSDRVYANATTVFGNATAAVRDIYSFDLISIGGEHVGGIYGDGNLTFVDGYRELHIANYGTDFYRLQPTLSKAEFEALNPREQAYYKLNYKCKQACTDKNGNNYKAGDELVYDDICNLFAGTYVLKEDGTPNYVLKEDGTPNEDYWETSEVKNIYEGRLINTIQRADMVGVFGSRLVLQGAQDRVPSKADFTNYTINRVGEVSLNQVTYTGNPEEITDDDDGEEEDPDDGEEEDPEEEKKSDKSHGNYFGIYSVVNFLGNLTSDVFFDAVRTTNSKTYPADGRTSYYDYKWAKRNLSNRNNATSPNEVALAAGVFLEITRESGEGKEQKDWGYVTGVIQLDLIDVMPGLGGGYVYAKNEHGAATHNDGWNKVILSEFNSTARTYKKFTYASAGATDYIETSGNFVHNTKRIVDDCYPVANRYYGTDDGTDAAPAHYWYIKGDIYVYDEYISAYTGSPNAYLESVNIPLTISATSRGKISLVNVQPNLYAVRAATVTVNGIPQTFQAGDAIDWWSYDQLTTQEKRAFAKEVYTIAVDCTIDGTAYTAGTVLTTEQYTTLKNSNGGTHTVKVTDNPDADFDFVVRLANNVSHGNGYVLTNRFDNPKVWDFKSPAPSFSTGTAGVYGQRNYKLGEIVYGSVVTNYKAMDTSGLTGQATMEKAYVVTAELKVKDKNDIEQHLFPGAPIVKSDFDDATWTTITGKVSPAKVVTNTAKLSDTDFLYVGTLLSDADITALYTTLKDLNTGWTDENCENYLKDYIDEAYYCTQTGLYGGSYFSVDNKYNALEAWCSLSSDDRQKFNYNYDALNVLIDKLYQGPMSLYDGPNDPKVYSAIQSIDYKADYLGETDLTWTKGDNSYTIPAGTTGISRVEYEAIPNEQMHFSEVKASAPGTYYIVTKQFTLGNNTNMVGTMIDEATYNGIETLTDKETYFKTFTIPDGMDTTDPFYFCYEEYKMNERGECTGVTIKDVTKDVTNPSNSYTAGSTVPFGTIISKVDYGKLPNLEKDSYGKDMFLIYGPAPQEESALYVARQSDIYDLSKEKIFTVVYEYDYRESDESGLHFTPVVERHILNIHINFKTGVPYVGELTKPSVVLPGTTIGMKIPTVTPGAFEVTSSGWEIFTNEDDANKHMNGQPYYNNVTPLYWYQDKYYVAYYAQTYLGKTYSNAVPFTVANYHDLRLVMEDKENHYYIDHEDAFKEREPKIYINAPGNLEIEEAGEAGPKNRLDILKDFFDLTTQTYDSDTEEATAISGGNLDGHTQLEKAVNGCKNLDIILRTNIDHPEAWESIGTGTDTPCFSGTLHGDGYYISGLDHSLFDKLCGNVYNLGVMGSFTEAGVANSGGGYVENCWVKTTGTPASDTKAVFGNPTREGEGDNLVQVVNCYHQEGKYAPLDASAPHGQSTPMPDRAFYNGEVAYDLNGFYLYKRYNDGKNQTTGLEYQYWKSGSDEPQTGHYASNPEYCSTGFGSIKYVEDRYADGDFIYADGTIPSSNDVRLEEGTTDKYYPIWPGDYIYFGQALTYGWDEVNLRAHQDVPSHFQDNRVYRAPAYFRSKTMDVAHFNQYAIFAQSKKGDASVKAYKDMTAIDFTGGNGDWTGTGGFKLGLSGDKFYAPFLDDDGLTGFVNADLTQNLLAYTGTAAPAAAQTDATVNTALPDVAYSEIDPDYRNVAQASTASVKGHQVTLVGSRYTTTKDHLLVDRQDFNAPMAYTMGDGKRMWYQRTPDLFVDRKKGWEGISIPFMAELVTTNQKGEITHFYEGSSTAANSDKKIGHEYWLREFTGITTPSSDPITAVMTYPANGSDDDNKVVKNTFLWDYYYYETTDPHHVDENVDTYQTYYNSPRTYNNYGYLQNGTPYIIGFPGATYYEFDLSGIWKAETTADPDPNQLGKQTVTFASKPGYRVGVSDDEMVSVTKDGYTFKPTYLNETFEAGKAYLLDSEGGAYQANAADGVNVAFRPYFTALAPSPSPARPLPRSIVFDGGTSSLDFGDEDNDQEESLGNGRLMFSASGSTIFTTSSLRSPADVRIYSVGGTCIASFTIQPGETVETPVSTGGVYITRSVRGKKTKKIMVK